MTAKPGRESEVRWGCREAGERREMKVSLIVARAKECSQEGAHFAALNVQANVFFRTGRSMI